MRSELDFIHYIKKSFGLRAIGDDCAILPKDNDSDLVVTADLLVEGIDFRLDWSKPEFLGHKALAVSLSDIAAVGGDPIWSMLSIGVPQKLWETDFVQRFYEGWTELSNRFGVELVGGDISRSPDRFIVDSIVGGELPKGTAILRSGAGAGDCVFVSGCLGGAAGGLRLLEENDNPEPVVEWKRELIDRQLRPTPRVELGKYLRETRTASSMIDISDGLSSDIYHICEQSGVGAKLDSSLLPIDKNLEFLGDNDEGLALALNGGEDFDLLFTVPKEKLPMLDRSDITKIGTITANAGLVELYDGHKSITLQPSGYRHF